MADPIGIIGLTGTVQQLVELTKYLVDSYQALKENTPAAAKLLHTYQQLQSMLSAISLDSFQGAQHTHLETVQHELDTIKKLCAKAKEAVERKSKASKSRALRYFSSLSDKAVIEELTADADKIRECIYKLSLDANLNWRLDRLPNATGDQFSPTIWAEKNPPSVYVDLNAKDEHGRSNTCESKLKEAILCDGPDTHVGAVAIGQGGVGKTCTLRAIANDPDVVRDFPGGTYLLSVGKDASIGTIIQRLCEAVKASGGLNLASKLQTQDNLSSVVAGVQCWFKDHASLFIFDDMWMRNDIDGQVLQTLSRLVNTVPGEGSRTGRILYSTRDEKLSWVGHTIPFEPRAHHGARSLEILLHVAGEKITAYDDPESRERIRTVLDVCAGLPLALNVAGSTVRLMRKRWKGDGKEAWTKYSEMINEPDHFERQDPGDGYSSLHTMLYSSLQILDENKEKEMKSLPMAFHEMHRTLCVLKRQDWLPLSILQYLWGRVDRATAQWVVTEMQSVGVAELQYLGGREGVRLHDLTHDFATSEAKEHGEVEKWHKKLLDKYRTDDGSVACTWSSSIREHEKEYVFENIYRVCQKAGRYEEMYRLLQSARWVTSVLQRRAFFPLEQAVKDLTDLVVGSREDSPQEELSLDEDCRFGLRMIAKAVRLSVPYVEGNVRNVFFQLYARLMEVSSNSPFVSRFLKDVEKWAPKPWLKAIRGCVTGADGALLERINVDFHVEKVKFSSDGVVGCGIQQFPREIHVVRQNLRKEVTVVTNKVDAISDALLTRESEGLSNTTTRLRSWEEEVREGQIREEKLVRKMLHLLQATVRSYRWCCRGDYEESSEDRSEDRSENISENISEDRLDEILRVSCSDVLEDLMAVGWSNGTIQIRNLNTNEAECTLQGHTARISNICFSEDGKRLVSGSDDATVRVWDVGTGAPLCDALEGHNDSVRSAAISGDGKRVVSGSDDTTVRVWDVATGASLCNTLEGHGGRVRSVAISGDGKLVVSGSDDRTVRVWDVGTGAPLCDALEGHSGWVTTVAISGDRKRVVSGSDDKTVRVWDVGTGAPLCNALMGHGGLVRSVAISGDGKRVVSGSYDKTVRVWDVATGAPLCNALVGHRHLVRSVAISGDGKRVVSGSHDWTVRVWDVETGASLCNTLEGQDRPVSRVAISGDGKRVVSGSYDETARVWEVTTGECWPVLERSKWDESVARYCGSRTPCDTSPEKEDEHYCKMGNSIVMRNNTGSEEVVARFDSELKISVLERRNGVVVVGFDSGAVGILQIIK